MISPITNDELIRYITIMLFVGIGVMTRDYYENNSRKKNNINFPKLILTMIVISTFLSSIYDSQFSNHNIFVFWFVGICLGTVNTVVMNFVYYVGESIIKVSIKKFDYFINRNKTDKTIDDMSKMIMELKKSMEDLIDHQDELDNDTKDIKKSMEELIEDEESKK